MLTLWFEQVVVTYTTGMITQYDESSYWFHNVIVCLFIVHYTNVILTWRRHPTPVERYLTQLAGTSFTCSTYTTTNKNHTTTIKQNTHLEFAVFCSGFQKFSHFPLRKVNCASSLPSPLPAPPTVGQPVQILLKKHHLHCTLDPPVVLNNYLCKRHLISNFLVCTITKWETGSEKNVFKLIWYLYLTN